MTRRTGDEGILQSPDSLVLAPKKSPASEGEKLGRSIDDGRKRLGEQRATDKGLDNVGLREHLSWTHAQGSFRKYTNALHEAYALHMRESERDIDTRD